MRQSLSSALPETGHRAEPGAGAGTARSRLRSPVVERIAGWSIRHRKTAVLGWLALVVVAFAVGQLLGTPSLPQYDAGQSGRAEQTLQRLGVVSPPAESVLIQARAPGATLSSGPVMRQAARQVAAALGGLPRTGRSPAHLTSATMRTAIAELRATASSRGPVRGPVTASAVAGGRALIVDVPLAGEGAGAISNGALVALRDRILPATLGQAPGVSWAVAGETAGNYDDIAVLHSRTPLVLAVVAVLAFLLLLVAFRSVPIPLVSVGLNMPSVGAAYGLVTLIFQDGRLEGLLGFTGYGAIVPWGERSW